MEELHELEFMIISNSTPEGAGKEVPGPILELNTRKSALEAEFVQLQADQSAHDESMAQLRSDGCLQVDARELFQRIQESRFKEIEFLKREIETRRRLADYFRDRDAVYADLRQKYQVLLNQTLTAIMDKLAGIGFKREHVSLGMGELPLEHLAARHPDYIAAIDCLGRVRSREGETNNIDVGMNRSELNKAEAELRERVSAITG